MYPFSRRIVRGGASPCPCPQPPTRSRPRGNAPDLQSKRDTVGAGASRGVTINAKVKTSLSRVMCYRHLAVAAIPQP